jgi:DNA polymerase (family 10)
VARHINVQGDTKSSILTKENVQVDLRVVEAKSFGAALLYSTGSKNFNVKLRQLAMKKNMKVNEYGVFLITGGTEKCVASKTEEECLKVLGLPYIDPELREDIGEAELFTGAKCPTLVEVKDIKGEVHVHSIWSDGRNTIAEMVEAAKARGYEYLAISDHSPKLRIAGGVSPEDLKKKKKEIDQLNSKLKDFTVLFGTEVEIDSEGNLDYNDKILSEFDVVIAAIHSGFEQPREQLTRRIIKACQSKHVDIIAHPTGVNIGKRDPYDIDLKEICKVAVDTNTFLEINASPMRLDLNSANSYFARSQGVKFVINTDAHSINHFDFLKFGVAVARRGWLTKKHVMNTLSWPELKKAMKS